MKEISENSPHLLQAQSQIQGDQSLFARGKCHEHVVKVYASNLEKPSRQCIIILNKTRHLCWGDFLPLSKWASEKLSWGENIYVQVHYSYWLNKVAIFLDSVTKVCTSTFNSTQWPHLILDPKFTHSLAIQHLLGTYYIQGILCQAIEIQIWKHWKYKKSSAKKNSVSLLSNVVVELNAACLVTEEYLSKEVWL
jgi:hypothetical protein